MKTISRYIMTLALLLTRMGHGRRETNHDGDSPPRSME